MPETRPPGQRAPGLPGAAPGTRRPGGEPFSRAKGAGLGLWRWQAGPRRRQAPGGEQRGQRGSRQQPGRPHSAPGSRFPPVAGRPGSWPQRRALPTVRGAPASPSRRLLLRLAVPTAPVQLPPGRRQSQARPRPSSSREAAGRAGRTGQAAQEKPRLVPPLPPRGPGDREARGSSERRQPAHVPSPARGSSGPAAQRPARCCWRRRRGGEAQSIAIREGEGRRVEPEPGSEAAEGSRARRRRSKSAPQAATPPTATWGAAETADRGARAPTGDAASPPLPRRCSPRRLGLGRTFLPRPFYRAPWRPSRFPVSSSALVHARPGHLAP